jgi:hypothetical protein
VKSVLAVATLAIVALVLEDRARQLAGDAQDAYGGLVDQTRLSTRAVSQEIEAKPILALAVAGTIGYALSRLMPRGRASD